MKPIITLLRKPNMVCLSRLAAPGAFGVSSAFGAAVAARAVQGSAAPATANSAGPVPVASSAGRTFMPGLLTALSLVFFAALPSFAHAQSFDEAWQQLQQVSDKLAASSAKVDRARAERDAGEDMNLPELSLNGSYTRLEKPLEMDLRDLNPLASLDPKTLPPALGAALGSIPGELFITPFTEQDIFRASLSAMWPIYTGGRISAAQGIHEAQLAEEQQQRELTRRELFTTLVDRYYGVMVAAELARTQDKLVVSLEKHVEHAKKLEAQGQIAKVERLNAEVALDNARVQASSSRRQYEITELALRSLLKSEPAPSSPLFIASREPSLPYLAELTQKGHPALKLLDAKESQANGLIEVERGAYKPTVFLYGNYTLYEDDSLFAKMEPDWMLGVGFKMPLLARDGRSGKVEAARSALLQARHTKAQTREDLSLLLEQSYRQLKQAEEEYRALASSRELALENLRLRELAFNQGMSTSIERVDAELKLTAVDTQQLGAKFRYVQAYARLMAISGQLDDFVGQTRLAPPVGEQQ
ncbi:TolC family protein [Shewanella khirikhana]|uniref:Outer membrane efflux protein n=1 Tax=Shewanella khirikhana TaxID=1965282 RepID=A0ABM7DR36_9GAMM|nr:Outer membrane efflux protein [Shewanella khirikhana]